jgi:hypothetical protein
MKLPTVSSLVYIIVFAMGALLIFIIFTLSGDLNPFSRKLHLKAQFVNAYGLQKGSKVLLAGVKVGKVESISFLSPEAPNDPVVEALMSIDGTIAGRPVTERIRTDSAALPFLLGNEPVIDIRLGSSLGQPINDYGVLASSHSNTVSDFATAGPDLGQELKRATKAMQEMTDQMRQDQFQSKKSGRSVKENAKEDSVPAAEPNYSELLEKLTPGIILYNPPSRMTVGRNEEVLVRLTKKASEEILRGLIPTPDTHIDVVKKIGSTMKVQLKGDGFTITPINTEAQVIADSEVTEWSWDVVPTTSGTQKLRILVTVVLDTPNGQKVKDTVLDKEILVSVNPLYSTRMFVATNWQYIVSTIIGSGVLGIALTWRRRNKKRPSPPWEAA